MFSSRLLTNSTMYELIYDKLAYTITTDLSIQERKVDNSDVVISTLSKDTPNRRSKANGCCLQVTSSCFLERSDLAEQTDPSPGDAALQVVSCSGTAPSSRSTVLSV